MTTITITGRDARTLVDAYDRLVEWIRNHAELCGEPEELARVDRAGKSSGRVIDQIETQLKTARRSA